MLDYVVPSTCRYGEDYQRLQEVYGVIVDQWTTELMHVTAMVGGVVQTDSHYGRGSATYAVLPAERQRAALRFLIARCFTTPADLLRPDILPRIEAAGAADRLLSSQTAVLNALLSETRARRMVDQCALSGGQGYTLDQTMEELRRGLWSELAAPRVVIDPYRRNLQRAYLQLLSARVLPESASPSELRPLSRGALVDTKAAVLQALNQTTDRPTRLHLLDCVATIDRTLTHK